MNTWSSTQYAAKNDIGREKRGREMENLFLLFCLSLMANIYLVVKLYITQHDKERVYRMYRDASHGFIRFSDWEGDDDDA
jgi:hypothetical protein